MIALGRLLRLSLLPSAVADVVAGLAIGGHGEWSASNSTLLAIAGSLGVYHGAMALNDWADRDGDEATRPERPIPSGAISPGAALTLGSVLVGLGVVCYASVSVWAGLWMLAVATCAVLYDLIGRGPLLGPSLLGLCRAGNMGVGILVATSAADAPSAEFGFVFLPALLYGGYVFSISRLGRLEDDEDPSALDDKPRRYLKAAIACFALIPFLRIYRGLDWGTVASLVIAWSGAFGLVRTSLRTPEWSRADVGRTMGMALRRLLVFSAACVALDVAGAPSAWLAIALILSGYPLSYTLRKVFPPT